MKKIICALTAIIASLCVTVTSFAAYSNISVKNNSPSSKPVSYSYDPETSVETVKSIKSLMTKLEDLPSRESVVQTLTVTSESANGAETDVKLRVSLPQKAAGTAPEKTNELTDEELAALAYYNIKVTTAEGDVLYDSETDDDVQDKAYKDISLGTMNGNDSAESKIFNITLSVNKDITQGAAVNLAKRLDWSIVTGASDKTQKSTVEEKPESETEESGEVKETAEPQPQNTEKTEETAAPSEKPAESAEPAVDLADKHGIVKLETGEYEIGKGIESGRYTMTGKGKVHVYTDEGVLKTTIALKDKDDDSQNGVDEYIITLTDGETIEVETAAVLTPYSLSATPAPTAGKDSSGSSKSSNNSSSSGKSSTSSGSKSSSSNVKSNPKTGDTAPLEAVSIVGIAAFALFVFVTVRKSRNNK